MPSGEEEFIEALRENGTMDMVRAEIAKGLHHDEPAAEEPAPTGEQPRDPESGQFVSVEEPEEPEEPEQAEAPEEEPEALEPGADEEEEIFLDLTPEVEEYLQKFGGDLNKALASAREGDSFRGRQANEIGDLRSELTQLRESLERQASQQPYPSWPDLDESEPEEVIPQLRSIAEAAFQNEDKTTMERALYSWHDIDPVGAETYAQLKAMQVVLMQQAAQPADETSGESDALKSAFTRLEEKYPDIGQRRDDIAAQAERWPTLARRMAEGSPEERVQAIEDLYLEAQRRTVSANAEQAMRRVRIRTSEEARQARQAAQVAQTTNRGSALTDEERPERKVRVGDTGLEVDLNRVSDMIRERSSREDMVLRDGQLGFVRDGKFVPAETGQR